MTTREKAHKLLDELPESEIEPVLDFIASRRPDGNVDEWGDLDAFSTALTTDTLRRLDEEERSAGFRPGSRNREPGPWRGLVERASHRRPATRPRADAG